MSDEAPDVAEILVADAAGSFVQLPFRRFPSMTIQGDALHRVYGDLLRVYRMLPASDARSEVKALLGDFRRAVAAYKLICRRQGMPLPWHGGRAEL